MDIFEKMFHEEELESAEVLLSQNLKEFAKLTKDEKEALRSR